MVNIYVLELKGGKYYVGKTNHTFQRFNQHKTGSGAKWTQKHKVVDLFAFHKDMRDSDENKITIQMMKKYSINSFPVVDSNNNIVGAINMNTLIQAKLI